MENGEEKTFTLSTAIDNMDAFTKLTGQWVVKKIIRYKMKQQDTQSTTYVKSKTLYAVTMYNTAFWKPE